MTVSFFRRFGAHGCAQLMMPVRQDRYVRDDSALSARALIASLDSNERSEYDEPPENAFRDAVVAFAEKYAR